MSTANNPSADGEERTRVLCVDDDRGVRWILRMVIDGEKDLTCVGCIDSADRLVDEARAAAPDVVLLDANMPGKSALDAIGELHAAMPRVRTILYTGRDDDDFLLRARRAGAWGFVSKSDSPESLLSAVRK